MLAAVDNPNDVSFSNYGDNDFQERIIQALLLDPEWAEQMSEVIRMNYFDIESYRFLAKTYFNYYEKYRTFPSLSIFKGIIKEKLDEGSTQDIKLLSDISALLKKVKTEPDYRDLPYVKDKALDFCRKQAMKDALFRCVDLIAEDKYDDVINIMKIATQVGANRDDDHDLFEDMEARFVDEVREPIPIGFEELDNQEVLNGGLGRGELGILIASSGVGKSHWLVERGCVALSAGYNVLYITLEMSKEKTGRRFDAHLTGYNSRKIREHQKEVREWYKENRSKLGKLKIAKFPSQTINTNNIIAYVHRQSVKNSFFPDLIIVDYADEMLSTKTFEASSRHAYKSIYRDLRNMAEELKVAVWSASQANRGGSSADIITGENFAEAHNKIDVPDFIFSLACKPQEKAKGIVKGFNVKTRDGTDGQLLYMRVDRSTSTYSIIEEHEYNKLSQDGSREFEREMGNAIQKAKRKAHKEAMKDL